jgi:hypothetical protein
VAINAKGSVSAEILDQDGRPIPGFGVDDCLGFTGDSTRHTLRWRSSEFPQAHRAGAKRLRFRLSDADLYSYSVN